MNKKLMYNRIMEHVSIQVKKALNEDSYTIDPKNMSSTNGFMAPANVKSITQNDIDNAKANANNTKNIVPQQLKLINMKCPYDMIDNASNIYYINFTVADIMSFLKYYKATGIKYKLSSRLIDNVPVFDDDRKTGYFRGFIHSIVNVCNDCNLNWIDTSEVKLMDLVFLHTDFCGDISDWDVSNVTDMSGMFLNSKFNGDISKWNVSKVKNMEYMFCDSLFNGDISSWDVSNVTDMNCMFLNSLFNGDISKWNVSHVEDMTKMFEKSKFNGDISNWNISNVEFASNIFDYAEFNLDIHNWNIQNITDFNNMFSACNINDEYLPKK